MTNLSPKRPQLKKRVKQCPKLPVETPHLENGVNLARRERVARGICGASPILPLERDLHHPLFPQNSFAAGNHPKSATSNYSLQTLNPASPFFMTQRNTSLRMYNNC
jgi:hypothetical protein